MGMQYQHTLISLDKANVPSPAEVRAFLADMTERGVVPDRAEVLLRTRTGKMREYPNPFTGGTVAIETKDRKPLPDLDAFERAAGKLSDYEIAIFGEGRPRLPPLPVEADGGYFVAVTCYVSSVLRSTSDSHEEAMTDRRAVGYGELFMSGDMSGIFCDPRSGEPIEVSEAGAARFWIEFELGKFLFPDIENGKLELLNPEIVEAAKMHFGVGFVQGCCWG